MEDIIKEIESDVLEEDYEVKEPDEINRVGEDEI